tara:strand:- start:2796 stop:3524 length:729 start_codon:yes stop_codon:yes gene_type:complete
MKWLFIILILLIILIYLKSPIFVKSSELFLILKDMNYLNSFSSKDLFVRNVNNVDEYINKNIKQSISNYTFFKKCKLFMLIVYIDIILYFNRYRTSYFDSVKLLGIPWKFGLVTGNLYEDGLSHTRGDTIILSKKTVSNESNSELMRTLLHEKIHLYQRLYPNDAARYIKEKKYFKERVLDNNVRANPDIDNYIYSDKNGIEYKAMYRDNAKRITDVKYNYGNSQLYEHPYERMAIELEKLI